MSQERAFSLPALKVLNFCLGFFFLFLASSSGFFLAKTSTDGILIQKEILSSWVYLLQKSAHAHTNLFGLLHIAFASSLMSSSFSSKTKFFQTVGLFLGSFSMSALLFLRSYFPPGAVDYLGYVMGAFLSLSLLSLFSHFLGLLLRLRIYL